MASCLHPWTRPSGCGTCVLNYAEVSWPSPLPPLSHTTPLVSSLQSPSTIILVFFSMIRPISTKLPSLPSHSKTPPLHSSVTLRGPSSSPRFLSPQMASISSSVVQEMHTTSWTRLRVIYWSNWRGMSVSNAEAWHRHPVSSRPREAVARRSGGHLTANTWLAAAWMGESWSGTSRNCPSEQELWISMHIPSNYSPWSHWTGTQALQDVSGSIQGSIWWSLLVLSWCVAYLPLRLQKFTCCHCYRHSGYQIRARTQRISPEIYCARKEDSTVIYI